MSVWGALSSRARRCLVRIRGRGRRGEPPYRSPKEIALQNAADSLGVALGDYYPDDAEQPVDLSEPPHTGGADAASLDASREEMLAYIAGLRARRRRRQFRILGAAVLVAVASVSVVVNIRPGSGEQGADHRDEWRAVGGPKSDGGGVPSWKQTTASAEFADGPEMIVGSAYMDQRGDICSKIAHVTEGVAKTYSGGGCVSPARIVRELRLAPAAVVKFEVHRRHVLLGGYARTDVRNVVVRRPRGHSKVAISGPWTSPRHDSGKSVVIKTFLIKVPVVSGRELEAGLRAPMQPGALEFAAILDDGRVQRVRGMWERNRPAVRRLVDPIVQVAPERHDPDGVDGRRYVPGSPMCPTATSPSRGRCPRTFSEKRAARAEVRSRS